MMSSQTSAAPCDKCTHIIYYVFYSIPHLVFHDSKRPKILFLIWWEIFVVPTAAGSHRAFCKPPQVPVAMQNPTQWAAPS